MLTQHPQLVLLLVAAVIVAGYRVSVRIHPTLRCANCRGTGRRPGMIFRAAQGPCRRCSGTGEVARLGARRAR